MTDAQAPPVHTWDSLHGHFGRPVEEWGNGYGVGIAVAALVALFLGLRAAQRLRQRCVARHERGHGPRLFREVLGELPLSARQRSLLRRMATDLNLRHPAQMLLSPGLFTSTVQRWLRLTEAPASWCVPELDTIAERIFPPERGS